MNVNKGALDYELVLNDAKFQATLKSAASGIQGFSSQAVDSTSAVEQGFNRLTFAAAGFFSIQAAQRFVSELINVRGEFQQLSVAMTTMLGSKEAADTLMTQLIKTAQTTPFNLTEVAQGAKQLLAYGTAATDVNDTLTRLGNIASGLSIPLGDMVYLYGTTQVQGRLYAQDVRQFMGRGIPLVQELAKQLGKTTEQVNEMVTAGKVGFPEVEKVIKGMTDQGGMFFDLMEKQSKTITGQISNLQDAFSQMLNAIGKDSDGIITGTISGLSYLVTNYKTVLGVIGELVAMYGAYKAAIITYNAVQIQANALTEIAAIKGSALTAVEKLQVFWLEAETVAQAALNKVMSINPYALLVTAVVGLTTAYLLLRDTTTATEKATAELNKENDTRKQQVDEQTQKTTDLINTIKSETSTRYSQLDAFKQLQAMYPGVLKNIDLLGFKSKDATGFQKQFNEALQQGTLDSKINEYKALQVSIKDYQDIVNNVNHVDQGAGVKNVAADNLALATEKAKQLNAEIEKQKELNFEATATDAEKLNHYNEQLSALEKQREQLENNLTAAKKTGNAFLGWKSTLESISLGGLNKQIGDLLNKIKGVTPGATKTNRQLIDSSVSISDLAATRKTIDDAYTAATTAAQRKQLAADLSYADKRKKALDIYADQKDADKKSAKLDDQYVGKKKEILDKINNLNEDYYRKSLTQNDAEVQATKDKYSEILKDIDAYNKKAPTSQKIGAGTITAVQEGENKAVGAVKYNQDTDLLKEQISKQKEIYQEYDSWKAELGKDSADKQFAEDKAGFDSYQDYIKGQMIILMSQSVSLGGMTPAMGARFEALKKLLKNAQDDFTKSDRSVLAQSLKDTQTTLEQIQIIRDKYAEKQKSLQNAGQLTPERQDNLNKDAQAEFDGVYKDLLSKEDAISKAGDVIAGVTKSQIRAQIESLQNYLTTATTLTEQQRVYLQEVISSLSTKMLTATDGGYEQNSKLNLPGFNQLSDYENQLKSKQVEIQKTVSDINKLKIKGVIPPEANNQAGILQAKLDGLNQSFKDLKNDRLTVLAGAFKDVADIVSGIAQDFSGLDENISSALSTIASLGSSLFSAFSGVNEAVKGIEDIKKKGGLGAIFEKGASGDGGLLGGISSVLGAAGPIASGIGAAIGAVTSVVSIFKKAHDSAVLAAKQLQELQIKEFQGELDYNALLRKRALMVQDLNDGTLKAIELKRMELEQQLNINGALDAAKASGEKSLQTTSAQEDAIATMNKLLQTGQQITGHHTEKKGLFGLGGTKVVDEIASLQGAFDLKTTLAGGLIQFKAGESLPAQVQSYKQLLDVYAKLDELASGGKLTDATQKQFEALQTEIGTVKDLQDQYAQLQEQAAEAFSGTTAGSIADSIIEGFKQGKKSINDFADDFDTIISGSILTTIKESLLSGAVKKVWDDFQQFVQENTDKGTGNVSPLTAAQQAALKNDYNKAITDTQSAIDQIQSSLGIDLFKDQTSTQASLSGSIKGITQETADVLAGLDRNMLDINRQQLDSLKRSESIFSQSLNYLAAIQVNTGNTVNRLDSALLKLDNIITNTKPSTTTVRDAMPGL